MARKRSRRTGAVGPDDPGAGPSVEWGWHGQFPVGYRLGGLAATAVLIGLLLTTRDFEEGATAVLWLVGAIVVILVGIAASTYHRRRWWRGK
jgi:hypothetical protein